MGLLFSPQVIYEHGELWWSDVDKDKTPDSSTRVLSGNPTITHLVANQKDMGEGNV
jgi:hypothetical protein